MRRGENLISANARLDGKDAACAAALSVEREEKAAVYGPGVTKWKGKLCASFWH